MISKSSSTNVNDHLQFRAVASANEVQDKDNNFKEKYLQKRLNIKTPTPTAFAVKTRGDIFWTSRQINPSSFPLSLENLAKYLYLRKNRKMIESHP